MGDVYALWWAIYQIDIELIEMKKFERLKLYLIGLIGLLSTTLALGENLSLNDKKTHWIEPSAFVAKTSDQTLSQPHYLRSHAFLTEMTTTAFDKLSPTQQQTMATRWGLSASEYAHYLELMEDTPDGLYYRDQHLDPSWILGMNAKNETERKKYVTLAILHERERMAKLLLFQQTFDRLQHELFPDDKPIQFSNHETTIGVPITCRQNY